MYFKVEEIPTAFETEAMSLPKFLSTQDLIYGASVTLSGAGDVLLICHSSILSW